MYNKLFTKILDSTIWLEPDATRLVWITFIAAMDEDGFVALSSVGNVAARARVTIEAAESAIRALESPDSVDPHQDNDGRRIERVPSGWMVLNASKYRDIIRRATAREQTRERVAKHRARNADVTQRNAQKRKLTPSVAVAVSEAKAGRGTRLPADWTPTQDLQAWAYKTRPDLSARETLERFRDYWIAQPGQKGVKLDWDATFRNWVRGEKRQPGSKPAAAETPTITCSVCKQQARVWTAGKCDPCWRKEQGIA